MIGNDKQSISYLRLVSIFASIAVLIFSINLFVSFAVKKSLQEFDERCTFDSIEYGYNSIVVNNLRMPGYGIFSSETSVLLSGDVFHPVPFHVVFSGVEIQPALSGDYSDSPSESNDFPMISVVDGRIPLYSTSISGTRMNGMDICRAEGLWGELFIYRTGDSVSVAFTECSGIPGMENAVPDFANGHSISGSCKGVISPVPSIVGLISELDGKAAAAVFQYRLQDGKPCASLEMDFSQVAEAAMALLDSISTGAIMTAVPSGSLSVSFSGSDSVFFSTRLHFDSLSIWSTALAPDTFSMDAALFVSGFVLTGSNTLVIDSGIVHSREMNLFINLVYSWGERRKLDLIFYNDALSGEAVARSIPPELLGRLSGLVLGGELSMYIELLLDWDYPDSSDVYFDIDVSRLYVGYSPVTFGKIKNYEGADCIMSDSWGNSRCIGLDTLTNPDFVFFDSIPDYFEPLLSCAEDASFRRHNGFSRYHVRNSIRSNMAQGRFVRGGSTISMQLAKNLFLGREKTLARKLQEVFLTWRLEKRLTKDRILEIYANIVELGPGVFGFDSAAMYYFNEGVSDLSVREMAFLVSILPGPRLYHRYAVQGELPAHWKAYVGRLITICGTRGWLDDSVVTEALADSLIFDGTISLI